MSMNITKIKIRRQQNNTSNKDTEVVNITDGNSIKKIIFNGKSYLPSNGEVLIDSSFAKELLATKTLRKKIYDIKDIKDFDADGNPIIQYDVNDIIFIKENDNELSGYSCFLFDDDGNAIRLTTPSQPFATEDLDFSKVLSKPFPKFANWWSFKNYFDDCYPDNQAYNISIRNKPRNLTTKTITGTIVINEKEHTYNNEVIYCLFFNQETSSGLKNKPYIIYKIISYDYEPIYKDGSYDDDENDGFFIKKNIYYIKHFVDNDSPDGILNLRNEYEFVNETSSSLITLNQFARNIERIK